MTEKKNNGNYSLVALARSFGVKKIFKTPDLWPAIIITILVCWFYLPSTKFPDMASSISITLIGADAGLLGIVLAGFAIMISLLEGTFKEIIKKAGLFDATVFLFTFDSLLIGLGLIFSIFFSVLIPISSQIIFLIASMQIDITRIFFVLALFFSTYGLFSVVWLLFHMRDLAMLKGELKE